MEPTLKVNGVPLDGLGFDVITRTGWRSFPGFRATTIATSNADGVLVPNRRAPLQPGALNLAIYVTGKNYVEFTERIDTIMSIFATPNGTVPVEMNLDPEEGYIRVCEARTLAAWTVNHEGPNQADVNVVMEIPAGTWTTTDYFVTREQNVLVDDLIQVECWNPTYTITDSLLLIRDPGTARYITMNDEGDDTINRPVVSLNLQADVASNRSILVNFGQWTAGLISRPDADDVTEEWFADPPLYTLDLTSRLVHSGPMYGQSILTFQPGATPLVPRMPSLIIDAVDELYVTTALPDVFFAVKPRWT